MEYKFSGTVTLADYAQFNAFHLKHSLWGRFKWIYYLVLFVVLAIFLHPKVSVLMSADKEILLEVLSENKSIFIAAAAVLLLCGTFLVLQKKLFLPMQYQKHYESNKLLQNESAYVVTTDTVSATDAAGTSCITKDLIHKVAFDKDALYIYLAKNIALIIKKHFFSSEAEYTEFVEFVKANYCK